MPYVQAGKVCCRSKIGARHSALFLDIRSVAEAGFKGYEFYTWFGDVAPVGTPREVIARLNQEVNRVIRIADVHQRFVNQGAEVTGGTPKQFGAFMKSEIERLAPVVRKLDLRIE